VEDDHPVFYDFCSLSQIDKSHPDFLCFGHRLPQGHEARRSAEEDRLFKVAVTDMHLLYTMGFGAVLVLPHVPHSAENPTKYIQRGWCFFEFSISAQYGRIVNFDACLVQQLLESVRAPLTFRPFLRQFEEKHFTARGDSNSVRVLYKKMSWERLGSTCVSASLLVFFCCLLFLVKRHYTSAVWRVFGSWVILELACVFVLTAEPFPIAPRQLGGT